MKNWSFRKGESMTDFEKVKKYYQDFDEKERLKKDASGRLEYKLTMKQLHDYLPEKSKILDLGGAAGAYSIPLAKMGYQMVLADLSEELIKQAKETVTSQNISNILSCDVVNAVDLRQYQDEQFDAVLLFGPLYHLTEQAERQQCICEVSRVLKQEGIVFASFIPYLSGSIAILDRYFRHPEQVNKENLQEVFSSGKFRNQDKKGFQEGYYPTTDEIEELFAEFQFQKEKILSIRGFGYEKEEQIDKIEDEEMLQTVLQLIEKTATCPEIVAMCGHAMYIGRKGDRT